MNAQEEKRNNAVVRQLEAEYGPTPSKTASWLWFVDTILDAATQQKDN